MFKKQVKVQWYNGENIFERNNTLTAGNFATFLLFLKTIKLMHAAFYAELNVLRSQFQVIILFESGSSLYV